MISLYLLWDSWTRDQVMGRLSHKRSQVLVTLSSVSSVGRGCVCELADWCDRCCSKCSIQFRPFGSLFCLHVLICISIHNGQLFPVEKDQINPQSGTCPAANSKHPQSKAAGHHRGAVSCGYKNLLTVQKATFSFPMFNETQPHSTDWPHGQTDQDERVQSLECH